MTQVVKALVRESGCRNGSPKELAHPAAVHRRTDRCREDVSGVLPKRAGNKTGLELLRAVCLQGIDRELGQRQCPARSIGLGVPSVKELRHCLPFRRDVEALLMGSQSGRELALHVRSPSP